MHGGWLPLVVVYCLYDGCWLRGVDCWSWVVVSLFAVCCLWLVVGLWCLVGYCRIVDCWLFIVDDCLLLGVGCWLVVGCWW